MKLLVYYIILVILKYIIRFTGRYGAGLIQRVYLTNENSVLVFLVCIADI